MRVLNEAEVEALLEPAALIDAVAAAMVELSSGAASMPPRVAASVEGRSGLLLAMPAHLPGMRALTTKVVALFPENAQRGVPTHQAVILVFDPDTGTPLALLDGRAITAARTAAASALATRLLARADASVLTILGTGVQARAHARFLPLVRDFDEVRVAGRSHERAEELADELERMAGAAGVHRAVATYEDAVVGADVVCACTHSPEPVVRRQWLSSGAHVNSVGFPPEGVELDERTVADAVVVVESRGAALAPPPAGSNDLTWRIRDGVVGPDHVHAELGELLTGERPGRTSDDQITLYKSVGVAVEDAAAAVLVLRAAEQQDIGRTLDL